MDIPKCKSVDYSDTIDKAVTEILNDLQRKIDKGCKFYSSQINTCHCASGGYPMTVINDVAKRFVEKGYFVYLIRGGAYNNWTWLNIQNYESSEGYTEDRFPNYIKRIH